MAELSSWSTIWSMRLLLDLLAAFRAMGNADARPQQAEVVVDLRHGAHSGAGVFGGGLLVDGDGRGKPFDIVHIRLFHLPQKLPGIRGKRLHIPALPFGIDGIKGQGALARTGDARDHQPAYPGECSTSTFFRLCSLAPLTNILSCMVIHCPFCGCALSQPYRCPPAAF